MFDNVNKMYEEIELLNLALVKISFRSLSFLKRCFSSYIFYNKKVENQHV